MNLKKIQAVSGVIFAAFVVLHLLNTWLAALGAGVYDSVQTALRVVYQFAPVELVVLSALVVHIAVGIVRIVIEPKRTLNLRARLHRYAGLFLMVFVGGHILAVRGASWFFGIYPKFEGLAFSIDAVPGYFYPYYFLLALAGFYHGLNGVSIAAGRFSFRFALGNERLRAATAMAGGATVLALLGFGGWFFELGDIYDSEFARLAMELTGVTLSP